mmetsp:Transcript_45409/g.120425  ORF Transcript_45409/g.120425 Transcript_45409/m.120425 type:complete len:187 (-) Transcript_45409:222-782(-)
MTGPAAGPMPRSKLSEERMRVIKVEGEQVKALNTVLEPYYQKHGRLEESQVRTLLTELESTSPSGTPPTDDELKFIMSLSQTGSVELAELKQAIVMWRICAAKREEMEEAVNKFDRTGNGKLTKDELSAYLQALNDGIVVTESEVDWVFAQAERLSDGVATKPEIVMATAAWYAHSDSSQSCCVIS